MDEDNKTTKRLILRSARQNDLFEDGDCRDVQKSICIERADSLLRDRVLSLYGLSIDSEEFVGSPLGLRKFLSKLLDPNQIGGEEKNLTEETQTMLKSAETDEADDYADASHCPSSPRTPSPSTKTDRTGFSASIAAIPAVRGRRATRRSSPAYPEEPTFDDLEGIAEEWEGAFPQNNGEYPPGVSLEASPRAHAYGEPKRGISISYKEGILHKRERRIRTENPEGN